MAAKGGLMKKTIIFPISYVTLGAVICSVLKYGKLRGDVGLITGIALGIFLGALVVMAIYFSRKIGNVNIKIKAK